MDAGEHNSNYFFCTIRAPHKQVMIAEFTFGHKLPEISRVVLRLLHFR